MNKEIKEEKRTKYTAENERDNNYINHLNKLEYLKDNIFYAFDKMLDFFAFENYSFKSIFSYDLSKFRIKSLQPAKYSNKIFIIFELKKIIKILEYDILNKSIYLSKKQIKEPKLDFSKSFYKCIDHKNGNLLTQSFFNVDVWKADKKNNYIKELTIPNSFQSLYDINESLFCFQDRDYKIYFYDSVNYYLKKTISYNLNVNLIGTINNESIVFNDNKNIDIFIVDIKYLEIVHIIKFYISYSFIKLKNNELLLFEYQGKNNLIIHKNTFDPKEKLFKNKEIIKKNKGTSDISNILITDNGYVVLVDYSSLVVLNI